MPIVVMKRDAAVGTLFLDGVAFEAGDESWASVDEVSLGEGEPRAAPSHGYTIDGHHAYSTTKSYWTALSLSDRALEDVLFAQTRRTSRKHRESATCPGESSPEHMKERRESASHRKDSDKERAQAEIMALHGPARALMLDDGTVFDEVVCNWHDIKDPGGHLGKATGAPGMKQCAGTEGGYTITNISSYYTQTDEAGPVTRGNRAVRADAGEDSSRIRLDRFSDSREVAATGDPANPPPQWSEHEVRQLGLGRASGNGEPLPAPSLGYTIDGHGYSEASSDWTSTCVCVCVCVCVSVCLSVCLFTQAHTHTHTHTHTHMYMNSALSIRQRRRRKSGGGFHHSRSQTTVNL
jgi:hypothetical protein